MICKFCGEICEGKFCSNCGKPLAIEESHVHQANSNDNVILTQADDPIPSSISLQTNTSFHNTSAPMSTAGPIIVLLLSIICCLVPNIVSVVLSIMALSKASKAKEAFINNNAEKAELENSKGRIYFKYSWICLIISLTLYSLVFMIAFIVNA